MCGIFGIFNHSNAINLTLHGLLALQHRGQEAAGISYFNQDKLIYSIREGLVTQAFQNFEEKLDCFSCLGHVRYSTAGKKEINDGQPIISKNGIENFALVHNGTLTNHLLLRERYLKKGHIFTKDSDSEVIPHVLTDPELNINIKNPFQIFNILEGAYSLIFLFNDYMLGIRDPYGFRPLVLGKKDQGYILASETSALDTISAEYIREIEPGEIIYIDKLGYKSLYQYKITPQAKCIFEYIYFSRPDSIIFNKNVYNIRLQLGKNLAKEHPIDADIVVPIPDSGNESALGYSLESGIELNFGFVRNKYIGRTFIQPTNSTRNKDIVAKLNPIKEVFKNKRVIIIDDSIVRGNTAKSRISMIRDAGAKEIHVRIPCPPIKFPCFFGIDFPKKEELIAHQHSIEEIEKLIGADSLRYLSLEKMLETAGSFNFCSACFSGKYPFKVKNF